ncbi:MAG: hypothetical protein K0V04_32860 [Deltaproteobacteria bacterium]|nr:hypothetical protein [Deltaproteobacteria bacterium]
MHWRAVLLVSLSWGCGDTSPAADPIPARAKDSPLEYVRELSTKAAAEITETVAWDHVLRAHGLRMLARLGEPRADQPGPDGDEDDRYRRPVAALLELNVEAESKALAQEFIAQWTPHPGCGVQLLAEPLFTTPAPLLARLDAGYRQTARVLDQAHHVELRCGTATHYSVAVQDDGTVVMLLERSG